MTALGGFLLGTALCGRRSTTNTTYSHHTTVIKYDIHYPDDWNNYSVDRKLNWLKNRNYMNEYYDLLYKDKHNFRCQMVDTPQPKCVEDFINTPLTRETFAKAAALGIDLTKEY